MMRTTLTAVAAMAITVAAWGGEDEEVQANLTIGDEAAPIEISHWLKGDVVEEFEDDNVYVIEFWATWCGPCVASMPHLSKLQEKYEDYDVTFIGVSDEPLQTVVDFLHKTYKKDGKLQNERTQYTLTTDPDKSVHKAYHKAAGRTGIPSAFIVGKDQRIEWIGHPMEIDGPLDAVVRDSWDRQAFKTLWEEMRANERIAEKHQKRLQEAMKAEDWPAAVAAIDELASLGDEYAGYRMQQFMILATKVDDYDRAFEVAAQIVDDGWDEPMMLNQIAWVMVDEPGLERRDLKLAMRAAKRADELTDGKDGAILDTLARVYYEDGDLDKALVYQRKAVKHADGRMLEDLQKVLKKYEREADSR